MTPIDRLNPDRVTRTVRRSMAIVMVGLGLVGGGGVATAQAQTANQDRYCQTLRNCNFSKNGSFRGCVSSYSCRSCRLVTAKCSVGTVSGACRKLACDWG
jgi:hypothetical protein